MTGLSFSDDFGILPPLYIFLKTYRGEKMFRGETVKMLRAEKMYRGEIISDPYKWSKILTRLSLLTNWWTTTDMT